MNFEDTYINLFRKFKEWEWYKDSKIKALFIHCLIMANWTDKTYMGIDIKRGQFMTSIENLSIETGLSIQEVRTALNKLIRSHCISKKSTNKYTIITVLNYEIYQQTNNKQITNKQQTSNKQITTTNKVNKVNKDNKIYICQNILEIYNSICVNLPNARDLTDKRITSIYARYKEHPDINFFKEYFEKVSKSDFLNGSSNWKANIDWLMKPGNMLKVLEGQYDNQSKGDDFNGGYYGDGFAND